jgi:glucose-6-phosphate dehydrogenase assembly protein OpcA
VSTTKTPEIVNSPHAISTRWKSDTLDPRAIERELRALWETRAVQSSSGPVDLSELRTSTVNLIAVADTSTSATRLEQAIVQLHEFAPARALVLNITPASKKQDFDVEITIRELQSERGRTSSRFEVVRVTAEDNQVTSLASIASPLLLPELPTFLFWPGSSLVESPLFAELTAISDRLIIDSAALENPGPNFRELARIIGSPRAPVVSDFAWRRLTPWRSLLAQFFDNPDALPELDVLDEVELVGKIAGKDGQSGISASLLLAGWLASSLNWRTPGSMVKTRDGWRVTLRSGIAPDEREILLRLRQKALARYPGRILSVAMRAEGVGSPSTFSVERVSENMVQTYSEFGGFSPVTRGVPASVFADEDLLSKELASLARDSIYESALRFAVSLMPEEG